MLAQVAFGSTEVAVVTVVCSLIGTVLAGSWKALRDQQKDHAEERKEWMEVQRSSNHALDLLTQQVHDLVTISQQKRAR